MGDLASTHIRKHRFNLNSQNMGEQPITQKAISKREKKEANLD